MLRHITATSSLWLVFFVNGAVLSSWAPRIPAVAADLGLTDGELGVALFGVAAGSVPTLLLTARVLHRVAAATLCRLSGLVFAAALPLIAPATDLALVARDLDPAVFLLAVALAGARLGPLFPAVISAAGHTVTGDVGTATATVTAVGYLAYLAGPPLVGLGAEHLGLATTITVAAGVAGLVMVLAAVRGFARVGQRSR